MGSEWLFIAGICSFLPYLLFIPCAIYGTMRLYHCKNELFVQKRNLSIALGLNCAFIFQMIASCLSHLSILHLNHNWIIYYYEKWTYYVKDMEWQQIINPTVKDSGSKRNWFITNRYKYGNRVYIFKLFGFLHFLGLTLSITAQCYLILSDDPNAIPISTAILICTIVPYNLFYAFLVFRTPRFNDIFNIHWESQMHVRLIVIVAIGLIAFTIWFAIDFTPTVAMLCFPFVTLMLFIMTMVSTLFVIGKTEKRDAMSFMHAHTALSKGKSKEKRQYTMDCILETKETFHLFMAHLSKEFSLECLLAYVEMTQFQQYMIDNNTNNNKIAQETIDKLKLLIFPSSIPMSHIVDDDIQLFKFKNIKNNDVQYKLKLAKLFAKYVKIGAPYEINISYSQRNAWMSMMSTPSNLWSFMQLKVDLNEILLLIEQCKTTLNKLLEHSLNRFKTYAKFEEVISILDRRDTLTNRWSNTRSILRMNTRDSSETGQSKVMDLLNRLPALKPRQSLSKSKSAEQNDADYVPPSAEDPEVPKISSLEAVPTVSLESSQIITMTIDK
eukprot:411578_1